MTLGSRDGGRTGNMLAKSLCLIVAALPLLAGCAPAGKKTAEPRCLQRTEAAYGYQARWVRCPPGSPVVLPDDY